jgi:alpha-galactosidase
MKVTAYYMNGTERDITDYVTYSTEPLTEADENFMIVYENVGSDEKPYDTIELTIKDGLVKIDNGGNALALGFCAIDECESLCRSYFRHARKPVSLVTMSNTWGDRNGFSRVCRDFVLKEIDSAKQIGVDIVQIDDGWQVGSTADLSRRDENGSREFLGDFWDLDINKFPNGMKEITDYAEKLGIKVGMWFAPESHNSFALLDRDISVLKKAYDEWGIRFFKLDMYYVTNQIQRDKFLRLLSAIYSFGPDVSVQLDVTRSNRLNYICGREYGTVFVENRYTKTGNAFPHRVLRNLWMISKYIPTSKFQFELINPDLNDESYACGDPFKPSLFTMDYLFATVMLSNPLFWMEMQFLPKNRRDEMANILSVYKGFRKCIF